MPQSQTPTNDHGAEYRERLDASILRALGERRLLRLVRTRSPSGLWDALEHQVTRAATLLWETSSATVRLDVLDDLLAWCAFLARELEITEALDLDAAGERDRLRTVAPRAIEALDAIMPGLLARPRGPWPTLARALACTFGDLRATLAAATAPAIAQAA